jgi:hypothetical protein
LISGFPAEPHAFDEGTSALDPELGHRRDAEGRKILAFALMR